jgi:hypothetical protein
MLGRPIARLPRYSEGWLAVYECATGSDTDSVTVEDPDQSSSACVAEAEAPPGYQLMPRCKANGQDVGDHVIT